MSNKAIKELRKAIRQSRRDDFADGTVLRWTSGGRYTYAAIKTAVGWFTSARPGNPFVESVLDFDGLLEVLSRPDASDVEVAVVWENVAGGTVDVGPGRHRAYEVFEADE